MVFFTLFMFLAIVFVVLAMIIHVKERRNKERK